MFVSALAAGLLMFAEAAPAADVPATSPQPAMKKVCVRVRSTDSNMPRTTCKMVPVKPEEASQPTDGKTEGPKPAEG